jgi:hypothetical protein
MIIFPDPTNLNFNLDTLNSRPVQLDDLLQSESLETDSYLFDISGTRNINLSLNTISNGDDADRRVYRDSNDNRILGTTDSLLASSILGSVIMVAFPGQTNINLGTLSATPIQRSDFLQSGTFINDSYRFSITSTSNLVTVHSPPVKT